MNWKELINKHKFIAIICNNFDHFDVLTKTLQEQMTFSKMSFVEDITSDMWKGHLHKDHKIIVIICNTPLYHTVDRNSEYQFYTRSYKDYDTYTDWHNYTFINFSRDIIINQILK